MQTKYPIILVHGIAVKDIRFFRAFGYIDRILKIQGHHVYLSKHDAFGTMQTNGEQIKAQILKIMEDEGVDKVNIIAHSKGGLDAKYMIKELDMEDHVASLTTLCTPHRGSPIASNVLRLPKWILAIIAFFVNTFYRIFGDKHPNALEVCHELERRPVDEKDLLNFSDKVYCQSFSCTMKKAKDDFWMSIPLAFSHYFEKKVPSDGLVPQDSTVFGVYRGEAIDGSSISHSEIMDYMTSAKKKDKIYHFYSKICEELVQMGY